MQIENNAARIYGFQVLDKPAGNNIPPRVRDIRFLPGATTEVDTEDYEKIKDIPLFVKCVEARELLVFPDGAAPPKRRKKKELEDLME